MDGLPCLRDGKFVGLLVKNEEADYAGYSNGDCVPQPRTATVLLVVRLEATWDK